MTAVGITWPTYAVEINFSGSTWTDVSADIYDDSSTNIVRNAQRQQGLWQYQAGRLTVRLRNNARKYDPTNTSSVYYPNVVPRKGIRVKATYSAVTYTLFTGTIDLWDWQITGRDSYVIVTATDGTKVLTRNRLPTVTAVGAGDSVTTRAGRILDAAGWSATDRTITTTAVHILQGYTGGDTAWALLQNLVRTEAGDLWIGADGKVVVKSNPDLQNRNVLGGSWANYSTGGSNLIYSAVRIANDETQIFNQAQVQCLGGPLVTIDDTGSQTTYGGVITYTAAGLIGDPDGFSGQPANAAVDHAGWILHLCAIGQLYFSSLTVDVGDRQLGIDPFPVILTNDHGSLLTVTYKPPGTGSDVVRVCIVRGVTHDIGYRRHRVTYLLEDATRYQANGAFFLDVDQLDVDKL